MYNYNLAWMKVMSIIDKAKPYQREPQLDHGHYKVWSTGTMDHLTSNSKMPEWVKEYELVKTEPLCPIWTVQWNHHRWTFTSEEEAWLFASYWKLI